MGGKSVSKQKGTKQELDLNVDLYVWGEGRLPLRLSLTMSWRILSELLSKLSGTENLKKSHF